MSDACCSSRCPAARPECLIIQIAIRGANNVERLGQQSLRRQFGERRQQEAAGQIPGRAKEEKPLDHPHATPVQDAFAPVDSPNAAVAVDVPVDGLDSRRRRHRGNNTGWIPVLRAEAEAMAVDVAGLPA
jgi:hypothetical protein